MQHFLERHNAVTFIIRIATLNVFFLMCFFNNTLVFTGFCRSS